MTLEEFKSAIENNTMSLPLVIAVCEDETSNFVFHQYLDAYLSANGFDFEFTDSTVATAQLNLFSQASSIVKVCYTNKLEQVSVPALYSLWVRCKSVTKDVAKAFEQYIIRIPKLDNWHIKDYVYTLCEGVPHSELDKLLSAYGRNIYRIDNEISKIMIFNDKAKLYSQIKDQLYNEVSEYTIFDLVNSLVKYDIMSLRRILLNIDRIDIDAFGFIKLLMTQFKRIIDVQLSRSVSSSDLGISDKQLWFIKKHLTGIYTKSQLLKIYELLTNCDYYVKSGYINTEILPEYIISKIITIKES